MKKRVKNLTTIVISSFPACGSSSLCINHNGDKYILMDLRFQRFKNTTIGNFPKNYVNCIEKNLGKVGFIFISSHNEVRKLLKKRNIKHFLIYPGIEHKSLWIERMKSMGYDKNLIKNISGNYEQLIFNMQSENSPLVYKYQLRASDPYITPELLDFLHSDDNQFLSEFHNNKD